MPTHEQLIRANVRRMQGYTPGEQPTDPAIIKLNTNECPYPPSPRVREALAAYATDSLRLYPDPVCKDVRRAIADLHHCDMEQVFFGNGSDEILRLCAEAFVENDGVIGFFDPSYSLYPVLTQIRDARALPTPLNHALDWPNPDPTATDLFFLTNPNAPGGRHYPAAQVEAFCRQARGVVVIDEAYVDFAEFNCTHLALTLPNTLALRTLSKSYSLAGLRAGYAIGPAPLIAAMYKIKDSYNVNRLTQILALAGINDREYMLAQTARIKQTRQRLAEALTQMGWEVWPSAANFLWVAPPEPGAARLYELLKERGILVRYFPGPRTGANLRISIGTDAQTDRLLETLRALGL